MMNTSFFEKFRDKKNRVVRFIEIPPNHGLPDGNSGLINNQLGILGKVVAQEKPLIPTTGGVGDVGFIIITPTNLYFYAFDYSKDLEGWKNQIEKGAEVLGIKLAKITDDSYLLVSDGQVFPLIDCEFEHYNFRVEVDGEMVLHKERAKINKNDLFNDNDVS